MLAGGCGAGLGWLGLAGCQPGPAPDDLTARLGHVVGGFAGQDPARGHALRDQAGGAPAGPDRVRRVHTLIAGGGVAGLAAARALRLRGRDDFALLEAEDEAGGNARSGTLGGLTCPWGAHYLPVPGDHNPDLQDLLEDLGLRRREAGRWVYDERHLCHSPQERLFFQGRWQSGLLPTDGVGAATLAQYRRFSALVTAEQRREPVNARYQIPHTFSNSKWPIPLSILELDALVFGDYLTQNGLTDPLLLTHLDYCCRDDYGAGIHHVSAWAGLHYFAARHGFAVPGDESPLGMGEGVLTWPEGNAWLTRQLAQPLGERLHTGCQVRRIATTRQGLEVDALNTRTGQVERWIARHCVVALPLQVAARVLQPLPEPVRAAAQAVRYAPWVVTNLHLNRPLADRGGAAPAWDNVVHGSAGLGYVDATHQALYRAPHAPTVLTHYRALGGVAGARAELLARPWSHWLASAVAEMLPAHPELPERLTQASVARHGHAMAMPVPGFLGKITTLRSAVQEPSFLKNQNISFAHSDWAAYSVFEEAFAMGHAAGQSVA